MLLFDWHLLQVTEPKGGPLGVTTRHGNIKMCGFLLRAGKWSKYELERAKRCPMEGKRRLAREATLL
jgi:hypothetical protein